MEDVAGNTEMFADFAKDGGKNIMLAAVEAKKLGVSLSEVSKISESLLEFEDSIAAQMEASMLLGREINLDRARQLNFAGDQVGMLKEINAQVGSEAEFNKMNVLQRRALAAAVGLSTEELGNLIREEETAGKAAAGIKWSWIGIGAAIGAMFGGVGAVPGAVIGGLIGGIGGSWLGARTMDAMSGADMGNQLSQADIGSHEKLFHDRSNMGGKVNVYKVNDQAALPSFGNPGEGSNEAEFPNPSPEDNSNPNIASTQSNLGIYTNGSWSYYM